PIPVSHPPDAWRWPAAWSKTAGLYAEPLNASRPTGAPPNATAPWARPGWSTGPAAPPQPPAHPHPPRTPRRQTPRDQTLGTGPYRRSTGHGRLNRPPRPD